MAIVDPDLCIVSTIAIKSDVSWILYVESIPLLLRESGILALCQANGLNSMLFHAQPLGSL
jgi:hypothetical protein